MSRERIHPSVFQNIPPNQINAEDPATTLPGRKNLRISLTPRCSLRCAHCHNEGQAPPWAKREDVEKYEAPIDAISQLVETASQFGLQSVKFTGGEPGLYRNFENLLSKIALDWQNKMPDVKWGMCTNGLPFLNPKKLALLVESPIRKVTFGIDSIEEDKKSKPSSPVGVSGVKIFKDVVIPLKQAWEGKQKEIKINVVYTGNEERVLRVVKAGYENGVSVNVIEANGVMGNTHETRKAYIDLLNKVADIFGLQPKYDGFLNQVYLYEDGNGDSPKVKFFQDHCADMDCGNCRKIHMRVVPTTDGFAAVPCFLQSQNEVIPLAANGEIDAGKFARAIPLLGIGPNWKNDRKNS
jgi:molybdenum cofactor biosynthesis enzyme MoaA